MNTGLKKLKFRENNFNISLALLRMYLSFLVIMDIFLILLRVILNLLNLFLIFLKIGEEIVRYLFFI